MDSSDLRYIFNHVFLPPKLPQSDDSSHLRNQYLTRLYREALDDAATFDTSCKWYKHSTMLKILLSESEDGMISTVDLECALPAMRAEDVLVIHIQTQNAGLIIRRTSDKYIFEAFELSSTAESVTTTIGRLRRFFPGPAIAIDQARILDDNCRKALIQCISQLHTQTLEQACSTTRKANSDVIETRETASPKFVTEMLTGILRAIGQPYSPEHICKMTRDEVLWSGALLPWRRSPRWLLLRVALQTTLVSKDKDEQNHLRYKSFMILFLIRILDLAVQASQRSEMLFVMTSKISRRMLKLGKAAEQMPWLQSIKDSMVAAEELMGRRWNSIQQNPDPLGCNQHPNFPEFIQDSHTVLSLLNFKKYQKRLVSRKTPLPPEIQHNVPPCDGRIKQDASQLPFTWPEGDPTKSIFFDWLGAQDPQKENFLLWLTDLEIWVQTHLQEWTKNRIESSFLGNLTFKDLAWVMKKYLKRALKAYQDSPESFSMMVLTLMDLWKSLDRLATLQEPLLKQYDIGFPLFLFDSLLLPKEGDMHRLRLIEKHIRTRRQNSRGDYPQIFTTSHTSKSLAVQFYDQSSLHQKLKQKIETAAANERATKINELKTKKTQYDNLMQESSRTQCSWEYIMRGKKKKRRLNYEHSPTCKKCRLCSKAKALSITIHEWPLPFQENEAKATVFELRVPDVIHWWREATYGLLADLFTPKFQTPRKPVEKYMLANFEGLKKWSSSITSRLQLASSSKEFSRAHYKEQRVSLAEESTICVDNGLHPRMCDSVCFLWTTEILGKYSWGQNCTFQLPAGPYSSLQFALDTTDHSSNEVLARQSRCSESLTLHEFYSFGTLRAGQMLQWDNIARELVSQILNFSHVETYFLIAQAIWECGSNKLDIDTRDSHDNLKEEDMLATLTGLIETFENNWAGAHALRTFSILVARILSLTSQASIEKRCLELLEQMGRIFLHWTRDVVILAQKSDCADELKRFEIRAMDLALLCHSTFDVKPHHLAMILRSSPNNVATLIECTITVSDRRPASLNGLEPFLKNQYFRFLKRAAHFELILRDRILHDDAGIDSAIRSLWSSYQPRDRWNNLPSPNERWMVTRTSSEVGSTSMVVHLNLLNGEFLVNGSPLSRLPKSYESHPTYGRLFGELVVEVVPSTMENMVFESRHQIQGQQVYFKLEEGQLVIKTRKKGHIHELVPVSAFQADFPQALIDNYTQWINVTDQSLEFRPLHDPWVSSPQNWKTWPCGGQNWSLVKGPSSFRLIDVRSPTALAITRILSPLEDASNIHVVIDCERNAVDIHLPRLNLDFFILNGSSRLESKQFRGMAVDSIQSLGSMTGLRNKLVLRELSGSSHVVIIPEGQISFERTKDHVRVNVDNGTEKRVSYHQFQIDAQLGRLKDNGSLRSRLYKIYLHAITSYCLPDKLTGRTGTEEALHGLGLSATQSFLSMERSEFDLLEDISKLTPRREYYPKHLKCMQTVSWTDELPFLSQHEQFLEAVKLIRDKASILLSFPELRIETPTIKGEIITDLYLRARLRHNNFRVHGFGAENSLKSEDVQYVSRDRIEDVDREHSVCFISQLVDTWSPNTSTCPELLQKIERWDSPILGPGLDSSMTLGFDSQWLVKPALFLPGRFCSLHQTLATTDPRKDKYRVMVFLATLTYSKFSNPELIQTLLAFATVPKLRSLVRPGSLTFDLHRGYKPAEAQLRHILKQHMIPFSNSPESQLPTHIGESFSNAYSRRYDQYKSSAEVQLQACIESLLSQWPTDSPSLRTFTPAYFNLTAAKNQINSLFHMCYSNLAFKNYVGAIQAIVDVVSPHGYPSKYTLDAPICKYQAPRLHITLQDLLNRPPPARKSLGQEAEGVLNLLVPASFTHSNSASPLDMVQDGKLENLLSRLSLKAAGAYQNAYIRDLKDSFDAFTKDVAMPSTLGPNLGDIFRNMSEQAQARVSTIYEIICSHLRAPSSPGEELCQNSSTFPRLSPEIVLALIASSSLILLNQDWKFAIVEYGIALTKLQRAERLRKCLVKKIDLWTEIKNPGHIDWDPLDYPDWLLLELECDILIRPEQAQIAKQMISPSAGCNSVMQLNMGLGKSSVIVPIVAATLADKDKLARVIVLKSLTTQMHHLLLEKLGGIINRPVFFLPISRSLKMDAELAQQIRRIYVECRRLGGVLLVQPEHLLSFELLGLDKMLEEDSRNEEVGKIMVETQSWLLKHTRDILDESDEILSVRFELIYTMGVQRSVDFSPHRWTIITRVLERLAEIANEMLATGQTRDGLEMSHTTTPGAFPRLRVLHHAAGNTLLSSVAQHICNNGLPGIPVWNLPQTTRAILYKFLTDRAIDPTELEPLYASILGVDSMKLSLLLLRGLFAGGILNFAFSSKRWRVNYGLDPTRTLLAVPYHAKDSPAARAEFSHPDTAIILTCLSYYYGGLTDKQIHASFEELQLSDQAQEEYEEWTRNNPLFPNTFRQLSSVNLSNKSQCSNEIFPFLRFSKGLIDFYMAHLVFPKEMKEFAHKLSSSGWEIGRDKHHPTTGFSGTNDSRYILPVPVKQCDLSQQLHTNAAVLDCLLKPENAVDEIFTAGVEFLTAEVLINMAVNSTPSIRVILDVGAQVLELRNEEVASKWLSLVDPSHVQAAIFVDDRNEICVLSRSGIKEPLSESPYAKQMDRCLVYLDEAHTRGTDLKMPTDYRALVTLGPDLAKDRLAQACKRMRKLGEGQSVVFCGSREVQRKILQANDKHNDDKIEIADVLSWCIQNTWSQTKKYIPLWATQGIRHYQRRAAFSNSTSLCPSTVKSTLEEEAQSLEQRYGFSGHSKAESTIFQKEESQLALFQTEIEAIREKCRRFRVTSFQEASLHEEQERELQPEQERETQVQRPPEPKPLLHSLSSYLEAFVANGYLKDFTGAFKPAFYTFRNTTASQYFESGAWPQDLLVTTDFAQTVQLQEHEDQDEFLRPVHWILSASNGTTATCVIISPHEANELLPAIRKQNKVTLHVYTPRLSLTNSSLEELRYCATPPLPAMWDAPSLVLQINLFAGQIYLRDVEQYILLCRFLGLVNKAQEKQVRVTCDGFLNPADRKLVDPAMASLCTFTKSPVAFLQKLVALRRKGMSFEVSHIGRILNGELLRERDFVVPGNSQ